MKKTVFTVVLFALFAQAMLLAQQVTDVNLRTLLREIANNEARANQTYNGKTLRLTGTASGMSNEYLRLEDGSSFILVYFNSSERTKVINLNNGQRITIRGVYAFDGVAYIRNAVIETAPAATAQPTSAPTPTPTPTPTPAPTAQPSPSPSILSAIGDFIGGLFSPKPTPAPTPVTTAQPSPTPNNTAQARAANERGVSFYNQSNWDSAIAEFTEAIRLTPNDALLYFNRGSTYYQKGDYDRAIADCTEAIWLNSNDARAYAFRGASYYYKGNYDAAINDYTLAIRLDPNNAVINYSNRGDAYLQKRDYTSARADVNRALQIDPNHQRAKDLDAELKRRGY
jgi:tetratricopeptide (TPR) repeat protein